MQQTVRQESKAPEPNHREVFLAALLALDLAYLRRLRESAKQQAAAAAAPAVVRPASKQKKSKEG